jgi:hypothetical protein
MDKMRFLEISFRDFSDFSGPFLDARYLSGTVHHRVSLAFFFLMSKSESIAFTSQGEKDCIKEVIFLHQPKEVFL